MEPRIQYAQTADGVSIAFWTLGEGIPFVYMPSTFTHIELEWQIAETRRWYERLAKKTKLIRYDGRGRGLSERDVTDYSLDALMLDLEAVVDHLGLERFALFGSTQWGPAAIAYAARHPERVSHLVLWQSFARGSDYLRSPQVRAIRALLDKDWETYTETLAHVAFGWSAGEHARRFAARYRESATQETAQAALAAATNFDVTDILSQVRTPTLVLHRRRARMPEVGLARTLASGIPEARLVVLEGESLGPYLGDTESVVAAIYEFLGQVEEAVAQVEPLAKEDVHTILFTDMEGSTALTQRVGDAKAQEVVRTHNTITRDVLKAHGGSEIKHTGDGFMASFPMASWALECAIEIQRALAQHNESNPDMPVRVRMGLNSGEPVAEDEDLFGTAVQLAARIAAKAQASEILASDTVRGLVAGKGFFFSGRGETALPGFEDPVRLYEVRWRQT
jgi:class 3 adenylate cyclase